MSLKYIKLIELEKLEKILLSARQENTGASIIKKARVLTSVSGYKYIKELHNLGLLRRIEYKRRYLYETTETGLEAIRLCSELRKILCNGQMVEK